MERKPKRSAGRPPSGDPGALRQLQVKCTDEEWQALLAVLPSDTRERYLHVANMGANQKKIRNIPNLYMFNCWLQLYNDVNGAKLRPINAPSNVVDLYKSTTNDGASWEWEKEVIVNKVVKSLMVEVAGE